MTEPDISDCGCIKVLTSCFRTRERKSGKALVAADQPGWVAPASSDIRESILPTSTTTCQTKLDLWREAYNELDDNTRKWIGDVSAGTDVKATTDDLVELVRASEEVHKESTPKLKIGRHEIVWIDYANNIVTSLTAIGDIAITFAPAPSSAVWSGIKVLMRANVAQCEDLVAILGCANIVLSLARRGRVYEEVYIGETPSTDAQEDLKQSLVRVYKKCLEFLAFVDVRFKQNRLGGFLKALLDPGQGKTEVAAVRDLEKELDMATVPCQAQRSEAHDRILRSLQEPLKRIDDRVAKVPKRLEKAELEQVGETISSIPVGEQHGRIQQRRTPGTGEWLIQDKDRFLQWEQSSCSSVFWLQGKLGTGKSFLSSKVIDRYRFDGESPMQTASQHDEGLAFFYCDRGDPAPLSSILRSYIRQLGEVPGRPECVHEAMYKIHADGKNIQNHISNEACKKALLAMINTYPRTTLILDGLDESSRDTRQDLIEVFNQLIREAEHVVKIFIASRVETDIEAEMESFQQLIYMDALDNTGDIERFVEQCISERKNWHISDDTKKEVKETLSEKRHAMFRWTYLQWEKIKIAETDKEVKQLLKKLPGTLREAYDEIYGQRTPGSFELVVLQRAVRWVISAPEPLSSKILLPAIWAESQWKDGNDDVINQADLNEAQLESICRHLITNDPHLGVWRFPPASVAEYFEESSDPWIKNGLAEVTTFLIRQLTKICSEWPPGLERREMLYGFWSDKLRDDDISDPRHRLQKYIYANWFLYVRGLREDSPKVNDAAQALKEFLGEASPGQPSSREYQVYCESILPCLHQNSPLFAYLYMMETLPARSFSFGIAAYSLHQLLSREWENNSDNSLVNRTGKDLLAISARFCHKDLCKSLISRGFDVNRPVEKRGHSALGAAIEANSIETIEFLLEYGAKPSRVMHDGSLLCFAAGRGSDIVRALLGRGADPNISCGGECRWEYALSRAAYEGDLQGVASLILKKADVTPVSVTDTFGSPLASAVHSGQISVVQLLLKYGANVNSSLKSGKWGSILAIAIFSFVAPDMVRFLVEKASADPSVLTTSPPPDPEVLRNRVRELPTVHRSIGSKAAYLVGMGHVKSQVLMDIGMPEEFVPPDDFRGECPDLEEESTITTEISFQ